MYVCVLKCILKNIFFFNVHVQLHRSEAAVIQTTHAFWRWLVEGKGLGWQMRGGVKLSPPQLAALVGSEFCEALAKGHIELKVQHLRKKKKKTLCCSVVLRF
jgi:hypothetical protein